MYRIKRFSEEKNSGMSTGAKVLAGVGTVAGGLLAAKKGLLGNSIVKSVNKGVMNLGKKVGSEGMMLSGAFP